MILRRVIAHFRKQEWTAIFLDFVIVVAGVFVGMQVTNWNAAIAENRREAQIVEDMLADLAIDRRQYMSGMAFDERRVGAANASMQGASLPPIEFDWDRVSTDTIDYSFAIKDASFYPAEKIDRLWTDLVLGFHPEPSTATYDAMIGAGDIKILKDRQIVREIQRYHTLAETVKSQNEKLIALRGDVLLVGAHSGLAPYLRTPPDDYFKRVAGEPELAASIRMLATFAIFHHGQIKAADDRAAILEAKLKAYREALE
ncbi:MAG TPA: hypothetical protein DDZ68_12025 [Parvularcula sp.]|nr:hypothetical protein [Parvularcula sp.]HBS30789.1 hypothetical protein [Parvularcula sp.]